MCRLTIHRYELTIVVSLIILLYIYYYGHIASY